MHSLYELLQGTASWPMPRDPMDAFVSPARRDEPDPRRYARLAPAPPTEGPIDVYSLIAGRGREATFELEIGFGRGMFLIERAQVAEGSVLVGIEIKRKWAYLVAERAARLGLGNVRAFGADARDVLARLSPDASFARVFMHFP